MRANRIDANQPEIVDAIRRAGAEWIPTSGDPNIGFDGVVLFRGRALLAEIKDESKPPSARRLTEGEEKRRQQCVAHGVPYLILLNPEQAIRTITAIIAAETEKRAKMTDDKLKRKAKSIIALGHEIANELGE